MRKLTKIVALLLLATFPAWSAIAVDTEADLSNNGGSTSTYTVSYTMGSHTNRVLYLFAEGDTGGGNNDCQAGVGTGTGSAGATYSGVAGTFVQNGNGTNTRFTYLWIWLNPASGAHNFVITCNSTHFIIAGAISYYNGAQTGQPDASNQGQSASTTSYTTSLTTVTNNDWVTLFSTNLVVAGSNCTSRVANSSWIICDSNGPVTPAGSYTMQTCAAAGCTTGTAAVAKHTMVAIAPAAVSNTTMPPVVF